jgi:CysZ protein
MKGVASALIEAFRSLLHPKMLALVLWPMLVSAVLWMVAAFLFWGRWVDALTGLSQSALLEKWLGHDISATASHFLIVVILAVLLISAIYLTALAITAIFAMPVMVSHVAQKHYPDLERKKGGSTIDGIVNTAVAIGVYCAGMALSLPFWLFGPLAIVLPVILMAYLNQRLFRYDALTEHASKEEYAQVVERSRKKFYLLGTLAGLLQFVPVLNVFLPVYMGLAFTHLCLGELKQVRQAP